MFSVMKYLRGVDLLNPYAWAVYLMRKRSKPDLPVLPSIVVGNLRVGGSGKTPLVMELAKRIPTSAVITLGYRKKHKGCFTSDKHPDPDHLGDEGYMILKKTGRPVVACKDRLKGALMAKEMGARYVIYDDAFQYFKLRGHVNLLLLRPSDLRAKTLPFGPLREPFSAYEFADILIFNWKLDTPHRLPDLGKPTFHMRYRVRGFVQGGVVKPLQGKRFFVFCAIADPFSFIKAVKLSGGEVVGWKVFPDHWWISEDEIRGIREKAEKLGAIPLWTEKDFYRARMLDIPYLKVDVELSEGFFERIYDALGT